VDIYLMQHGLAKTREEDPDRPLTDEGRATVERVAARAAALGVQPDRVYHSGLLRARQTAEILAGRLGIPDRVEVRPGLEPLDPVEPVASWLDGLAGQFGAVVLVGHLPFLDRLTSLLVAGDENAQVVAFRMGGLVKLIPKGNRAGYSVAWVLAPELA
jgi:phosphohistidine phosphatase